MSTHYTPTKVSVFHLLRWRRLVFEILVPLLLILSSANAWADGRSYAAYGAMATWFYIVLLVGFYRGSIRALQVHCLFGFLYFFGKGSYAMITNTATDDNFPVLIAGCVFGIAGVLSQVHYRILRLESPARKGRAAEFPGIYRITCRANGMQYIGMTERPIKARWEDHRTNLAAGRHHNPRLQLDWNTYRSEQFKWEVLEVVTDPVWVRDRERAWQDKDYDSSKRYNPPNLAPRIVKTRRPVMQRKR